MVNSSRGRRLPAKEEAGGPGRADVHYRAGRAGQCGERRSVDVRAQTGKAVQAGTRKCASFSRFLGIRKVQVEFFFFFLFWRGIVEESLEVEGWIKWPKVGKSL